MAVTKIWTIKDSLQRVLDYAANPDKTEYDALAQTLHYAENDAKTKLSESAQLVTGIHCRPDHAWEDMRAVQERFGKTDGVVALHAYQSFREGEVTPEQCHEIGVALARKVWGKRFQVLVATHMNTDNLHNHFVINSVSYVDGKKYEQRRSQYAEFRAASDKLCREYGLSVVEQPRSKEPARYARMREAIDQACEDASTPEDFHRALYRQGYIFGSDPHRKYATIRARDGGRAVRLYRAYYTLAITTGLRRGELCALQWRDITGACELTVRRSRSCASGQIVESDTKSHRERIVTIPLGIWELLMALRQQQVLHSGVPDREQPIFTNPDGHVPHPDTFTRHLRKLYKQCGLSEDYHLHTLRHFYATYLLQEGTSKQVAASLLGHADTAFLERTYCHPQDVAKRQAANLMQDLLNNQNPCYVAFMKNRNRKAKKAG